MILNKVFIKNYRQYRDVEIEFAKDKDKNFTIIKGNNGTGKTTLLNSLSWCLYGTEIHDYDSSKKIRDKVKEDVRSPICNNKSVFLANDGDDIEVSVKIEFLDDGNILAFHRVNFFRKTQKGLIPLPKKNRFEVIHQNGLDFDVKRDDYYTIERKIPEDIQDYFFFDGAKLSTYFSKTQRASTKNAVFNLSHLKLLENVHVNLPKVKQKYINEQRKLSKNSGNVQENINNFEADLAETKNLLTKAENEFKEIEDELNKVNKELLSKNIESLNEYLRRDKQLDNTINSNNSKLSNLKEGHKKHILTNYPYVLSYNGFLKFLKTGEESREKGFIPPKFKKSFIRDLLDSGKCICGNDISIDNEFRRELEKLLNEVNPLTDSSEEVTVALNHVNELIIPEIHKFKKISNDFFSKIERINAEQEKLIEEKRHVQSIIDSNPVEEIRRLNKLKKSLINEKKKKLSKITNYKASISRLEEFIAEERKKLNRELKNQRKYQILESKIDFCEKQTEIANIVYNDLTEEMRLKIQRLTKDKFIKIQWKDDEFVDISMSEDYEILIENRLGDLERPVDLSDGEKLCLGLCFMSALHNISGFDLPIIMDTPLGNLDVDMRRNIAKFLPAFVEDKQTILLVTGTEYTDDFRDIIYSAVGKEYVIEWDNSDEGKESKVILNV